MKNLVRRSGIVVMGLFWAAGWVLAGGVIEAFSNAGLHLPIEPLFDMWPMEMAIPGLIGGVVFSAMLWLAERRRFHAVAPARFAGWGALAGLLVGVLGAVNGLASELYPDRFPRVAVIIAIATALGAVSGLISGLVSRYASREARDILPAHVR